MPNGIEVFILFGGFKFKAERGFDVGNHKFIQFDTSGFEVDANDELGGLMGVMGDEPVGGIVGSFVKAD